MGGILVTFFPNNGDDGNKEDEADTDGVGQNGRFDHCKGGCAEQNAFNNCQATGEVTLSTCANCNGTDDGGDTCLLYTSPSPRD